MKKYIKTLTIFSAAASMAVLSGCTFSFGGANSINSIGINSTEVRVAAPAAVVKRAIPGIDLQLFTGRGALSVGWTSEIFVQPFQYHTTYEPGNSILHIGRWALPLGIWTPFKDANGNIVGEKAVGLTIQSIPRFRWWNSNDVRIPTYQRVWRFGIGAANSPGGFDLAFPYYLHKKIIIDGADVEIDFESDKEQSAESFKFVVTKDRRSSE